MTRCSRRISPQSDTREPVYCLQHTPREREQREAVPNFAEHLVAPPLVTSMKFLFVYIQMLRYSGFMRQT